MTTEQTMEARDLYLRHTDTNGKSTNQMHRVWDADKFLASQQDEATKQNTKVKEGAPRLAKVEQITRETYRDERTPHRP